MAKTITFLGIFLLSFQISFSETTAKPNAKELLDKFSKTQDVFRSFTAKTEVSSQSTNKSLNPQFPSSNSELFREIDFRFDQNNRRTNKREYLYGDVHPAIPNVPKDSPQYRSSLFVDQQDFIWYGRADVISDPGNVTLSKIPNPDPNSRTIQALSRAFQGHEALGYIYGHDKRIDEILRDTKNIRVHKEMQKVGGTDCYVIEAGTNKGQYTLWIDPEHGYNLARAKLLIQEGDSLYETTAKKGEKYYTMLDNVKFKQVDGTWVPVEAEILYKWKIPGKYNYQGKIQFKVKEYQLNPDHDALGSFEPDDIQNGAKVRVLDRNQVVPITYYWKDGELIPNVDDAAIDQLQTTSDSHL